MLENELNKTLNKEIRRAFQLVNAFLSRFLTVFIIGERNGMEKNGQLVCILMGWEEDMRAWERCALPILPRLDLGTVVEGKGPLLHPWRACG